MMKDISLWTPEGSCRAALRKTGGETFAEDMIKEKPARPPFKGAPVFPPDLATRAAQLDTGIESLFIAWEITRLAGGSIDQTDERALMLLALSLMLAAEEGSTRLPLENNAYLDRALGELAATAEECEAVYNLLEKVLPGEGSPKQAQPGTGLQEVFGTPGSYRPLVAGRDFIYIQKLYELENRVGASLRERITAAETFLPDFTGEKPAKELENALQEVLKNPPVETFGPVELDQEQVMAVQTALSGKIAVISGRPGSGKTSIVASILRVLARTGSIPLESIALAAPTGKAADKLRRAVADHLQKIPSPGEADIKLASSCPLSATLHRLLGYMPGQDRFRHNERNLLPEQLVIVDESSMIDLSMMDNLLRALRPEAGVVFLGDAEQLPSIEAGAVLRDLCRSSLANKHERVAILKKSYRAREEDRSGKKILDVATAINEGKGPISAGRDLSLTIKEETAELPFSGAEHLQLQPGDEARRQAFLEEWQRRLVEAMPELTGRLEREYIAGANGFDPEETEALNEIISHYERFRILCVTRVAAGGSGSEAVNEWFHHRWAKDYGKKETQTPASRPFLVGEPVMVTRNDYLLRLYNGDSGLVLKVATADGARRRPAEPMAVFPRGGGFTAFPLEALRGKLDHAWATTVHKAQGSEYDHVGIMLPDLYVRPLTRELLYTAVTRAKKSVVFVGPEAVLAQGANQAMERASGLTEILS